ncbi:MAG TPA: hydrogenase maturation protease [Acidimicrobiales bacterium]|nr:hydrogenase maturation protease [Acidimicrobiales bacterium]
MLTIPGSTPADTLIIGCGNLIRGDDAAGPILVRRLADVTLPAGVRLLDGGTAGMDVAFAMRGVRRVIIVDASRVGVPAGTIHHVPGEELMNLSPPSGNLHQFRWDQALGFATWLLKDEYPENVEVWLVEGEQFEPGAELSVAVDEAIGVIADRILESLDTVAKPPLVAAPGTRDAR